jgi:peptide/nickel transport system permease protein
MIGIPVGIISAIKRRSVADRASMGGALLAISAPVYWLGLLALYLFANDIGLVHIFDGSGTYTPLSQDPGRWFGSLILPWFVLAASFAAFYARLLRANLIDVMGEDYIRTARAKGLPERRVIGRHAMRSAITPIVTVLGLDIGILLGGAILTEDVFNIPGIGRLAYEGIINADLPVIQGTVLFGALFIVVANLVVDIAYAFLDPRVRYS